MGSPVEGGELIEVVELDQPFCTLEYGSSPCTAVLGTDGTEKCRNTFSTCQDTANYNAGTLTLTFVKSQSSIPQDGYYFPSLRSISHTPSKISSSSEGKRSPLGKRAKMSATFVDHPHTDRVVDKYAEERISGAAQSSGVGYDPLEKGTFWGKWRARNLYYFGSDIRTKVGVQDPIDFSSMTERHFVVERIIGPGTGNQVTIEAKDPLKLVDNDRAKAPAVSTGELDAGINDSVTSATLAPSGIGNSEYPASGKVVIGKEIMSFTRSGDTLTLTRAQDGTAAASHDAEDTVQLCLEYSSDDAADIVNDLLTNYTPIDASFIPKSDWDDEVANFLPGLYSTVIPKPTGVRDLIGELAEQVGFSIWWDERDQEIKLAAIKPPTASSLTIDDSQIIEGSLSIRDNVKARISQVWTSYGMISRTEPLDDENNYRSTLVTVDADAKSDNEYGQDEIREIHSRWIGASNKSAARSVNNRLLGRFRDVIKEVTFRLPSYRADEIAMGQSHNLETLYNQDENGDPLVMPIIILSIEPDGDELIIEAEELRFDGGFESGTRTVELPSGTTLDFNFREAYDAIWSPPSGSTDIKCIVPAGAVVGASLNDGTGVSFDVGDWSDYSFNSLTIEVEGRIAGAGGNGGVSSTDGFDGGTALYTRQAVDVTNNGVIAGGGGGGGGDRGPSEQQIFLGGGGGGAGASVGSGGFGINPGTDGTLTAGGDGGASAGDGGDPGQDGQNGDDGSGGSAGAAVDGDSYVTWSGSGSIVGSQVN